MFKCWLILFSVIALVACAAQPAATSLPPTAAPPTAVPATGTPIPTVAPSPVPATPLPSGPVIEHLSASQPITMTTVHMLDTTSGWGVGGLTLNGDRVLFTQDGGATWRDVTPPEPAPPADTQAAAVGFFRDAQTAWVTFNYLNFAKPENPRVWFTHDGGRTWQASQTLDPGQMGDFFLPSDFYFVDAQTGWLLAHMGVGMMHDYVAIFQTTDGGQTWARIVDPEKDNLWMSCSKTGLVFTDARRGWVTGDCQGVAAGAYFQRTTDGGATWAAQDLPAPAGQPDLFTRDGTGCGTYAPRFFSARTGVVVVACVNFSADPTTRVQYLYTTADGGETWTSAPLPARDVSFLDAQTGWTIDPSDPNDPTAARGVYQTLDAGRTWAKLGAVHWSGVLDFVDAQTGWVVAQAGAARALVQTVTGGQRWIEIKPLIVP